MAGNVAMVESLQREPDWPALDGHSPVFLLDAASALERSLLKAWIERKRPHGLALESPISISIPSTRRRKHSPSLSALEAHLAAGSDPLLIPLRVAWLPKQRNGKRVVRFSDLLSFSDPRDPDPLRARLILRRDRDRCRIVAGEAAPVSELRRRWQTAGGGNAAETTGLAEFVERQACLALERAERRLRGARYKVPRLVHENILGHPAFRGGLAELARELGRNEAAVVNQAARDLREIAATHSPFVIDLVAHLIRLLYTQGYSKALRYHPEQLREVELLAQRHPVVFLPSHKSNLDHLVLQYALHENGHPPNHTAGGINMNFFPIGPLVRRSGTFFIRRSFRDDAIYKFVLQRYIDYLIEKRFSLEWYIEGGRSRSGKLLPPRYGMLNAVVDAYRRGKSDEVVLIPTSLAYDQISDVGSYAAEQSGAKKQKEGFGWLIGTIRTLRRRYGHVHIRFGEPIFLSKTIETSGTEPPPGLDERHLEVQKLAFEVAVRINRVTPITPTSLVTMALLGGGDRALSEDEVGDQLANLLFYTRRRNLPTTGEFDLYDPESARRTLADLVENGVVTRYSDGPEDVYQIKADRQLDAAYYRNSVIHFFVTSAIAELALLRAAEAAGAESPSDAFWSAAMGLRDLLKFEFFFVEKEAFRADLRRELQIQHAEWQSLLAGGPDAILELLRKFRPFSAHRVLRPFLDAYRLVGDQLERHNPDEQFDEARFVSACCGLGRQYHLQQRIRSAASISQVILRTALELAKNRRLLDPAQPDLPQRRHEFASEIRDAIRGVDAIEALAASRRAGMID
ncbi:MAG: glycerol-3-phosphate 1-O-acyltransferase [Deltaproteobacteria bacterium]|nr:glycerol-3-phosphate 1-O-acyltransferase [Deltaproteobacteria bacterium]